MATGGRNDPRNVLKTIIPNRIFVGGITTNTNEEDLRNLFSKFGNVKSTKVIFDKVGISKGYGFVTFETDWEAQKIIKEAKHIDFVLKDRKLNINKAEKKLFKSDCTSVNSSIVCPMKPYSPSSEVSRESVYYPRAGWQMVWPQYYLQQQCYYPSTSQSGMPQYMYPVAPVDLYQSVASVAGSDYSETSADSGESSKNRPQQPPTSDPREESKAAPSPAVPHMHFPMYAKTLNGVTVMAYPNSFMMANPVVQLNDHNESDNLFTELGVPMASLTPPTTPLATMPRDYNPSTSMDVIT